MVVMEEEGISETSVYSCELGCRTAQPRAGKEKNHAPCSANGRETTEVPKAVMAASQLDSMRSSVAMECFTHSEPEDAARKKKRERKKETARWTPVPHVSKQGNSPLCTSILSSGDQSLVSPVFRRENIAKMIFGMALPHSVC